jgi:copper resistance protein B
MKTHTIAALVAGLFLATDAMAQHHGHHHPPPPPAKPANAPAATEQPRTPIPPLTQADRDAAKPPAHGHSMHDTTVYSKVLFNRLEAFDAAPGAGLEWEGQATIGTDEHKLWLRSEGERVDGHTESADLEVLYGRPIARWWDLLAGVRHDFKPGASHDWEAISVAGLAT